MTKGVHSVYSPVRNLQDFNPSVTHDDFVRAVAKSFRDRYGGSGKVSFLHLLALSALSMG
jgi:lipoate-protein ligase A